MAASWRSQRVGLTGKGNPRLCFLWVLPAYRAWFEAPPVPNREWSSLLYPAHSGAMWDPGQIPRAVVSQDTQVPSMPHTGLCLASLSGRAFESKRIPVSPTAGPGGTSGMANPQTPVPRTCRQRGQQTAMTCSVDRRGPAAHLPIHHGGCQAPAAGGTRV